MSESTSRNCSRSWRTTSIFFNCVGRNYVSFFPAVFLSTPCFCSFPCFCWLLFYPLQLCCYRCWVSSCSRMRGFVLSCEFVCLCIISTPFHLSCFCCSFLFTYSVLFLPLHHRMNNFQSSEDDYRCDSCCLWWRISVKATVTMSSMTLGKNVMYDDEENVLRR